MRILILSSSTGGGHDMRARSIEEWSRHLQTNDAPIEVERYQALEENARIYRFGVDLYNLIQKKCPFLHQIYFNWLEIFQVSANEKLLLGKKRFVEVLEKVRPDLIISVHAHTNHAFRELAKRALPGVRFVTYCGELFGGYGFSRHWVDPEVDTFIGATDEICAAAEKLGMASERVKLGGFLLNPKFYAAPLSDTEKIRLCSRELKLEPDRFKLLLSTGANGAQNHPALIHELEKAQLPVQIVALCGKSKEAKATVEKASRNLKHTSVCALGYRDDMFALMQIADAVVARPGTGTTSEAIMAGCPLLLNTLGGVMPQEWITVKYLRSRGLKGKRIKSPKDLATQLRPLLEDPHHLPLLREKMVSLRPDTHPSELFAYLKNRSDSARIGSHTRSSI